LEGSNVVFPLKSGEFKGMVKSVKEIEKALGEVSSKMENII